MVFKYPVQGYVYVKIPEGLANKKDEDGDFDYEPAEDYAGQEAKDLTNDIVRNNESCLSLEVETGRYEVLRDA